MLLGEMIARLQDPDSAAEALLALDDLALASRVRNAAADEGVTAGEFIAAAVGRLAAHADDTTWLTLVGQMASSASPGHVMLRRALSDAFAVSTSCHSEAAKRPK